MENKDLAAQAELARRRLAEAKRFCNECVDRTHPSCPKNEIAVNCTCRRCNEHLATIK